MLQLSPSFQFSFKDFSRKLKTRWTGPFTVAYVFPYRTIELSQADGPNFKVPDMSKVDKNKAKRTKPGTGMERVQEIEAKEAHDASNDDFDMPGWQSQGQSLAKHVWRTING
nr:reverse transcriptase domain-containing protein [Tanacetum cinerariifolium]